MSRLSVTLIDVGWGDSIYIESEDAAGGVHRALIDSNDTTTLRSSYIFLRRHLEKQEVDIDAAKPIFEFVMLSHAHADHGQGLKALLKQFGTQRLWYPKSLEWAGLSTLITYANRSSNVLQHQAVDRTKQLPPLGDVAMRILWPRWNQIDDDNENNNSIVLALELGAHAFVLTGDAEKEVWASVAADIPPNTRFFKVPHHGSRNGSLDGAGVPVWLDECPAGAELGISSHVRPFHHPHQEVLDQFQNANRSHLRTDRHYHITYTTDGQNFERTYHH